MPWTASRDGALLRARGHADVATALASLRLLVGSMERPSRFRGTVAAYDPGPRELVALSVANGRVTMRTLRRRALLGDPVQRHRPGHAPRRRLACDRLVGRGRVGPPASVPGLRPA